MNVKTRKAWDVTALKLGSLFLLLFKDSSLKLARLLSAFLSLPFWGTTLQCLGDLCGLAQSTWPLSVADLGWATWWVVLTRQTLVIGRQGRRLERHWALEPGGRRMVRGGILGTGAGRSGGEAPGPRGPHRRGRGSAGTRRCPGRMGGWAERLQWAATSPPQTPAAGSPCMHQTRRQGAWAS